MSREWWYGPKGLEVKQLPSGKLLRVIPKEDVHKAIVEYTNAYQKLVNRPLYRFDNRSIKAKVFRRLAHE